MQNNKIRNILIFIGVVLGLVLLGGIVWWLYIKFGSTAAASTGGTTLASAEILRRKLSNAPDTNSESMKTPPVDSQTLSSQIQPNVPIQQQSTSTTLSDASNSMWGEYHAIVNRQRKTNGPGTFTLYKGSEVVGQWGCITGGRVVECRSYGGLTPTTTWVMIEPIRSQKHPTSGKTFRFGRIVPIGFKDEWKNRTFDPNRWPFMIHIAGSSTGCISILPKDFKDFYITINAVFEEETFPIRVVEESA